MGYEFKEEANRVIALDADGQEVGEVKFTQETDNIISIDHTNVDESQRGQGLGSQLIAQMVEKAKNENLKVKPVCPYAEKQFMENEEYQSVMQD